jgi:hypothetical protein
MYSAETAKLEERCGNGAEDQGAEEALLWATETIVTSVFGSRVSGVKKRFCFQRVRAIRSAPRTSETAAKRAMRTELLQLRDDEGGGEERGAREEGGEVGDGGEARVYGACGLADVGHQRLAELRRVMMRCVARARLSQLHTPTGR